MKFHHVGCLVDRLEPAIERFSLFTDPAYTPSVVEHENVKICLLPLGSNQWLELVCPNPGDSGLNRMLEQGANFYHMAFTVGDIEHWTRRLKEEGFAVVASFHSQLFGGALCGFWRSPSGELIELIEEVSDGRN